MGLFSKVGSFLGKVGKGVVSVGKGAVNLVGKVIGGGGPSIPSLPGGSFGGGFPTISPLPTIQPSVTSPIALPQPSNSFGGILGDIQNLIQTATGIGQSVTNTVDKVGGALDVASGNKPIQLEGTLGNIPSWVVPLFAGLGALLLFKQLKRR